MCVHTKPVRAELTASMLIRFQYTPDRPFHNPIEPRDQEIAKFYEVQERRATDFEVS